jgi:hypothetical protein
MYAREYDYTTAHKMDFMAIDYDLAYNTQIHLVEVLAEILQYDTKDEPNKHPSDRVYDVVGEWGAVLGSYDLAELWVETNCYQPDIETPMSIHDQMSYAVEEIALEFLHAVIGDTETPSQALYRINKLFPAKTMATA